MPNQFIRVLLVLCCLNATANRALALTVYAQLFPLSGEVQLRNKDVSTPFPFIYYSITANNNALNFASNVWRSITDKYDTPLPPTTTPGNGFIDLTGEWVKISETSSQLTEGALGVPGGLLTENRAISLGRIWNSALDPLPVFDIRDSAGQHANVIREYALEGDYFPDRTVNFVDYNLWRQHFGSQSVLLPDGSLNGVVDAADYVIWRNNFGMTLSGTGFGTGGVGGSTAATAAVPEPAAVYLTLAAAAALLSMRRPRRSGCGYPR